MISMKITHWGQIPVFIGNRKTVGWGDGRNPNKPRPLLLGFAGSPQPTLFGKRIHLITESRKTVGWGDNRNPNKMHLLRAGVRKLTPHPASTPFQDSPWQPQGNCETAYHQYQKPDDKPFPGAGQVTLFLVMGNRAAVGALGHIIRDFFPAIQAIDRTHSVTGTARTGELVVYIVLA